MSREGAEEGCRSTATIPLTGEDLLDDFKFSGDRFSSAKRRSAPGGEIEVGRGQMRGREELQRVPGALY
jgi:hypothetical protein